MVRSFGLAITLITAVAGLSGCGSAPDGSSGTKGKAEPIPAAFDTAAGILSAQGWRLADCVAIADDKQKLACYAALGFKEPGDVGKVEALAGRMDILAGKRWQITAPSPGGSDSFQGTAVLTLAGLANQGPMAFRNSRITLRCPANWGSSSNMKWAASVDLPFDAAYDSNGKDRGTMAIDIDGKPFKAVQFSRSSFNVEADSAEAFRDAIIAGKSFALTLATVDGKSGAMKTELPAGGESLKAYFDKFCPAKG
ncbi:hypothetical protein [Sphingomonas sp.]|uniref:hypothetical protein n=1 Tax=Sphingomonas sp. TaxID=28214 RepID=UPI003D6CBA45